MIDILMGTLLLAGAGLALQHKEQRQRVALLGMHLRPYQIEKNMEALSSSYLRALDETEPGRREHIWQLQSNTELQLCNELERLVENFAQVPSEQVRVCRWPLALPYAAHWAAASCFDFRTLLAAHAQGWRDTITNHAQRSPKNKAYTMTAEMLLMQHSCHWFCKSLTVASARLLARHKTTHAQVLDAVSSTTRAAYRGITGY